MPITVEIKMNLAFYSIKILCARHIGIVLTRSIRHLARRIRTSKESLTLSYVPHRMRETVREYFIVNAGDESRISLVFK